MTSGAHRQGPLCGIRVIEMAGTQHGPVTFGGMILADMGADVIRIDRPRVEASAAHMAEDGPAGILGRGHRSIALDLKSPDAVDLARRLIERSDVLIEGFRPGVMERIGLGPEDCLGRNAALVYGRITGWGQTGPLAHTVGHDINYIALSGALHTIGEKGGKPVVPANLVGDMGGGGIVLALGVVAALLQARISGKGQVVDAAMVDGAILQMSAIFTMLETGTWQFERGSNLLDGGAPFYDTYECSDGRHVAVGAIEPPFYAALCRGLEIEHVLAHDQMDRALWPDTKALIAERIRTKSMAEWLTIFEGTNACVSPVLTLAEAAEHPHNRARGNIVRRGGIRQPGVTPVFSATPGAIVSGPPRIGRDGPAILAEVGFTESDIAALVATGAVHVSPA